MKKLLAVLIAIVSFGHISVNAQNIMNYNVQELEFTPAADPELDWSQFDEKQIKAILGKKGLVLESKVEEMPCLSVCELPINMKTDDFIVALKMLPESVDDDKPFGIVYDYRNDANYKMLLILKKSFQLVECDKGETSVVKKGMYKGKDKEFTLSLTRNKNKLYFGINGIDLTSQLNSNLEYPSFGFVIASKGKLTGKSLAYKRISPKEVEEEN